MGRTILFLVCTLASIWGANSISLSKKESVQTTYNPCGLGFIQFKRLMESKWMADVNLGLLANMTEVEMVIVFQKEVTIIPNYESRSITVRRLHDLVDKYGLVLHSVRPIPKRYTFHVSLKKSDIHENDFPYIKKLTLNNDTFCNENNIRESLFKNSLNVNQKFKSKHYAHVCGRKSVRHAALVSLRTEAKAGDWPWHVAIFTKFNKNEQFFYQCGGSIVSKTAILTAAHCFSPEIEANQVIVVAGVSSLKHDDKQFRQTLTTQEIIIHPAHTFESSTSDLAIIKVKNIEFTAHVQPVCISGPTYNKTHLFGTEATVVGFGNTEHGNLSDVLRATNTMVQDDKTCIKFSPMPYLALLNEFTFCAGYGPNSTINPRNGDSGGGLVVSTILPDHMLSWFLQGVISKCGSPLFSTTCDPKRYVVYTAVAPHYSWIYQHAGLEYGFNIMVS